MIRAPRPHQALMHSFGLAHARSNIFAGMGSGKTFGGLLLISSRVLAGQSQRTLVLAPKRVAMSTWPDELELLREMFPELSMAVAVGDEKRRIKALASDANVVVMNYDVLPWAVDVLGSQWDFDTVLPDESSMLKGLRVMETETKGVKGQGSTRAKAIARVAHTRVRYWHNLTGSPAPNGLQDVWAPMWFVDGGRRLGTSFSAFQQRWFRSIPTSSGYGGQLEALPHADAEIKALMKDVSLTIDPRDWCDIGTTFEHVVKVRLPPKVRKHYLTMEKQFFAEFESGAAVEVFNQAGKSLKLAQIGNGAVFINSEEREWESLHDEKIDALQSIVHETGGTPLLVRYCFTPDRDKILKRFPQFKPLTDASLKDFQAGRLPGIVLHAKSAGHGLNLQHHCWTMVDFGIDWNLEHDEQIIERVGPMRQFQIGRRDRVVSRYRIIAEDTIEDTSMLPRLKSKASVQDSLKEAMKRRTAG